MKRELDLVIISDTHLGTYGCHARELGNYLKSIRPKILVLNGDILDIWQGRLAHFPPEHVRVVRRILKMAADGTRVYYITGNHDDALRRYTDFSAGNIHLRDKLVLQLHGKRYWIFHGDVFDLSIRYSKWLARLGGLSYDWLIRLNRWVNRWRQRMGKPRMSFAERLKYRVKEAVRFVNDFEETAIRLAAEKGYDYVVCGHIHRPVIRKVTRDSHTVTYMNAGDWVENLTALECKGGRWRLFRYDEAEFDGLHPRLRIADEEPAMPSAEVLLRRVVG